jgi:hypothetical protein
MAGECSRRVSRFTFSTACGLNSLRVIGSMLRRLAPIVAAIAFLMASPAAQDRREGSLRPGDVAADFTLEPRGGGAPVTLSAFRGVKPVALVFGSYT